MCTIFRNSAIAIATQIWVSMAYAIFIVKNCWSVHTYIMIFKTAGKSLIFGFDLIIQINTCACARLWIYWGLANDGIFFESRES